MPDVTRREILGVIGIAVVVVAISSVPYLLGYLSATPDTEFGGFVVDLDDSFSYLAKMQQGVWDGWRYRIPFTTEEHPGAYLYTFYIALGKLSASLRLSLVLTYQLARLVAGLAMLISAYLFISAFLETREARLTAYLLVCFSSGLGWLVMLLTRSSTLLGLSPMDFWLMEAYSFFTLLTFPHASAAIAILLAFFLLALRYLTTFHFPTLLWSILALLGLCVIHPFMALPVDGTLAAYGMLLLAFRRRLVRREIAATLTWALTPIPLIAYYLSAFASDPVFGYWSAQNILPSPPLIHLLLGYGLVLMLAILGVAGLIRRRNEKQLFLVAWASSALLLAYAPLTLQRRMVEGLHVPLCILATIGLLEFLLPRALRSDRLTRFARWRGYRTDGVRRFLVFSVIVATLPSNLYLLLSVSSMALQHNSALFYERHEAEAIDWLKDNTRHSDTVLASYEIGRLIPARAGNVVFIGHIIETVQVERKRELAASFFQADSSDDFRRALLTEYGIRYVFHGPRERQLGDFDPLEASYLTPAYSNSSVTIYRVNLD
jgi:hypothetical protein